MADATLYCSNKQCDFSTNEPPTSPALRSCPKCGGKEFITKKQKDAQAT